MLHGNVINFVDIGLDQVAILRISFKTANKKGAVVLYFCPTKSCTYVAMIAFYQILYVHIGAFQRKLSRKM